MSNNKLNNNIIENITGVGDKNKNFKISECLSIDEVRKKGLVGIWYTK